MSDELLLGEVTDEVRAFLESQGRTVAPKPHQYLGPPGRPKRVSRFIEHDPPHPRLLGRSRITHLPIELEIELGGRATNALRMQANTPAYFSSLPFYLTQEPSVD